MHWRPVAGHAVADIRRADVSARLAVIASENGPFAADRARAALSALFAWALGEGRAEQNPVTGTNRPTEEKTRDGVLTDEELRLVWQEAGGGDYADIVRLLVLTGQRREEVGGMLWSEVSGDMWRIGAERAKNKRAHDVPLPSPARALLDGLRRQTGRDLTFGIGDGPFSGWGNAKASLDRRMLARLAEAHGKKAKLNPWRIHDIRRTVATRMADLGVLPHMIEAVLNHVSGHKAGIAGVYNRSSYAAEKHAALDLWGAHVAKLVTEGQS